MNKKIILFSLSIFLNLNLFCQKEYDFGKVIYEANLNIENSFEKIENSNVSKEAKNKIKNSLKTLDKVRYELFFNKNESIFKEEQKIKLEKNKTFLIQILVGKGIFYTRNKDKKTLNQKESFGELFLIDVPSNKWVLSQETKKIGKYLCYKATSTKVIENRRGKKIKKITAWYTPKINANYGPKEYGNLPGLILELSEGDLQFLAIKIKLNLKDNLELKKPTKGIKVTLEEHNKIIEDLVSKRRRN